ncbi:hypothetical protein PIB30_107655, partial [Stylosanthes scabra]|nr:hypothetical protein [Stylosanthes scabra]
EKQKRHRFLVLNPQKTFEFCFSVSSTQTCSSSSPPKEVRESQYLQHRAPLSINHAKDTACSIRVLRLPHRRPSSLVEESVFVIASF